MTDRSPLAAAGTALLAASLLSVPFAFALGLPWNQLGVWSQVEGVTVALHAAAALAAASLAVLIATGDRAARRAFASPAVLALGALGLASLALAPLQPEPWRSVHGTVKHGVGALWHLETAVLAAGYCVLLAGRLRGPAVAAATLSLAVLCGLYAFPDAAGTPLAFPEWVGLASAAVAGAVLLAAPGPAALRLATAAVALYAGWHVGENRAVVLAAAASGLAWAAFRIPALAARPALRSAAAPLVAVAALAAVLLAGPAIEARSVAAGPEAGSEAVASDLPIDRTRIQLTGLGTIWGRSNLASVAVSAASDARTLAVGRGWGAFSDAREGYERSVPGRMFAEENETGSLAYWDGHEQSDFHSHNVLAEALLSEGVIGAALWLAFLAALGWRSPGAAAAAVGVAVASSLWFPLGHFTPAIALLVAACSAAGPGREIGTPAARASVPALSALALALLLAASVMMGLAKAGHDARYFAQIPMQPDETCIVISSPLAPEAEVNADLYAMLVKRILTSPDPRAATVNATTTLNAYSCVLRRHWRERGDLSSLVASLRLRDEVSVVGIPAQAAIVKDILGWADDVDAALARLPARTDLALPYVRNLLRFDRGKVPAEAERLAAGMQASDPVRAWLRSVAARERGETAMADALLQAALKLGFANIVPLPRDQVDAVLGRAPQGGSK